MSSAGAPEEHAPLVLSETVDENYFEGLDLFISTMHAGDFTRGPTSLLLGAAAEPLSFIAAGAEDVEGTGSRPPGRIQNVPHVLYPYRVPPAPRPPPLLPRASRLLVGVVD
jgi:hypothetical protein